MRPAYVSRWTRDIAATARHANERRSFIKQHFLADIADPDGYDAVFNLRSLDPDQAAGLIIDAYRRIVGM